MSKTVIPKNYKSTLGLYDTQKAIGLINTIFQEKLCAALHLKRVTAPLFVAHGSGLNDDLNGVERPVAFDVPCLDGHAEIVHSLAKWKRYALYKYGFRPGQGLGGGIEQGGVGPKPAKGQHAAQTQGSHPPGEGEQPPPALGEQGQVGMLIPLRTDKTPNCQRTAAQKDGEEGWEGPAQTVAGQQAGGSEAAGKPGQLPHGCSPLFSVSVLHCTIPKGERQSREDSILLPRNLI